MLRPISYRSQLLVSHRQRRRVGQASGEHRSIPTTPSRFGLTFRDYTRAPFEPQPLNANASNCHESRPYNCSVQNRSSHPCVDGLARGRWAHSTVKGCADEWCAPCTFDAVSEGEARHCMCTRWPWIHFAGDSHMRNLFDGAHLPASYRPPNRRMPEVDTGRALSQVSPHFSAAPAESLAMPPPCTTRSASAPSEARASPTSSAAR